MRLHEALLFALGRVRNDQAVVTLARAGALSYQVRILPDRTIARGYRVSVRRWFVEASPACGVVDEGWSAWTPLSGYFSGFSIDDAVADDWQVLSTETP